MQHMVAVTDNESARLNALRDLRLLDTPPSEAFDRLTRLASRLLEAPVSTISLTDHDRQWFKSRVGVDLSEIPREQAPCSYAIQGRAVFVVPDMLEDARFAASPLAQAGIRFYAGAPLFTRAGHGLGTLAVVDTRPRMLAADEERVLSDLAGMVMSQVELQNMIGRVDPTTGAPNQHQLAEDLEDLTWRSPRAPASALLVEVMGPGRATDLGRALGPMQGDALMGEVLRIVAAAAGNAARVYHVGALRCVLLLDPEAGMEAAEVARRVTGALAAPVPCGNVPVTLDPVIGIYDFAPSDAGPRDVLRRLLVAAAQARDEGVACAPYLRDHEEQGHRRFRLLNEFSAALASHDQLSLVYQPRFELGTGRRLGVEALLRWTHPELGPVSPGEFIPLVERTAMARPLTAWVVAAALDQLREWTRAGLGLQMSVNVSAANLDEADFADRLLAAVRARGLDPRGVELEFTESAVARDARRVTEQLGRLHAAGVAIAIDDFGTGHSNVAYLQRLPVTTLKIDQSFVRNLAQAPTDRTLVRAMIGIGHDLGYRVVAEGIETAEAYEMLRGWGCDEGQGFLMSRPVAAAALAAMPGNGDLVRLA